MQEIYGEETVPTSRVIRHIGFSRSDKPALLTFVKIEIVDLPLITVNILTESDLLSLAFKSGLHIGYDNTNPSFNLKEN